MSLLVNSTFGLLEGAVYVGCVILLVVLLLGLALTVTSMVDPGNLVTGGFGFRSIVCALLFFRLFITVVLVIGI